MLKRMSSILTVLLILCVPTSVCAKDITNNLPQSELARYSDSFAKMEADVWERSQYAYTENQRAHFKLGKIHARDGKLTLETQTGAFSKAGLISKFFFQGDFDAQLDTRFSVNPDAGEMDQKFIFMVMEKGEQVRKADYAIFIMLKLVDNPEGLLITGCQTWGRFQTLGKRRLESFDGTLRFVRKGKKIYFFSRRKDTSEWSEMNSCSCTRKDVCIGASIANFHKDRDSIRADAPLSVLLGGFKINSAQGIVESDI